MKRLFLLGLTAICLSFSAQYSSKAGGLLYTDASYPKIATGAEAENLDNLKKGSAEVTNVLGLVEIGNASIDEIAKRANIKKICYVDERVKSILILFSTVTITVYGE